MNRTIELIRTIYEPSQLESFDLPQVALAGRSNVGKSSLVNCLGGRKKLAKISSTPGKTRSLNFYLVSPDNFLLVDLPGYGYARCSKKEREKWAKLIDIYIRENKMLQAVAVLLDSRIPPQNLDLELVSYLDQSAIPILAVLTKADKCKQRDIAKRANQWRDLLRRNAEMVQFSSKTGKGREKLWGMLAKAALSE